MWQKRILLCLVEAVNLIHEHDGARAVLAGLLRVGHHLLDFFDTAEHRRELDEIGLGDLRDDLGQRGLAYARWTPEDDRPRIIALDLHPQRLARREDVLLPHELLERA